MRCGAADAAPAPRSGSQARSSLPRRRKCHRSLGLPSGFPRRPSPPHSTADLPGTPGEVEDPVIAISARIRRYGSRSICSKDRQWSGWPRRNESHLEVVRNVYTRANSTHAGLSTQQSRVRTQGRGRTAQPRVTQTNSEGTELFLNAGDFKSNAKKKKKKKMEAENNNKDCSA